MKKALFVLLLIFCALPICHAQIEYGTIEEAIVPLLSLSISSGKSSYKLGEPVLIKVSLQNIDRAKRRRLFLSPASTLTFEIKKKDVTRKSRSYGFPEEDVALRVNASVAGTVDIKSEFKEAGRYAVSATYEGYLMQAPVIKPKKPTSNTLTITIVP